MMKLIRLIFFCFTIFAPLNAIESYIEFKVNNEIITNIDLENESRYLIALNNELKDTDKQVLMGLAKESIIREKIKKNELIRYYKLDSSQEYLTTIVKEFYEKMNIKNLNDFEIYLSEYNLELETVKQKIEIGMMWSRLIGAKYGDQININEEILKQQIQEFSDNSKFETRYELSEIVFQIKNKDALNDKIELIQKDIKEQGFNNTANIHSIADSSKFGGKLGWINEKQLSKKILNAIQKLGIGEISKYIKVANGFLIIKVENREQQKKEADSKKLLEQAINYETNKQYNQFSIIYYNKIKLNSVISEQ